MIGHRDAGQTACPGRYLYAKLPTLRAAAGAIVAGLPSLSLDRDLDNRGEADVLATNGNGDLLLYPTTNQRTIAAPKSLSSGAWRGVDLVTIAGDFTGDGPVDLIARKTSTGQLLVYPGSGSTGLRAARVIGTGWGAVDAIVGVSDWTGDRRPDLLARMKSDGSLRLYPGNGAGGFLASRTVGVGWSGMRLLAGVGDWNGDGARDLLAVSTAGQARIYRGNGKGGFGSSSVLTGDWGQFTAVAGIGDASADTRVDLFVVDNQGVGWVGVPSADRHDQRLDAADPVPGRGAGLQRLSCCPARGAGVPSGIHVGNGSGDRATARASWCESACRYQRGHRDECED